jgi:alkylation response protein AidB-like acyl-CoA dehydrogenase
MSYLPLSEQQQQLKALATELAVSELAPRAAETDRTGAFPRSSLDGLKASGLWGLRVAKEHGGLDADFVSTCLVVEDPAIIR